MAKYPKLTITQAGLDLITKSVTSQKPLIFTKAKLGSGTAPSDPSALIDMIAPQLVCEFTSATNEGLGVYLLRFIASNAGLTSSFKMKEIGVYAKCEGDSSDTLYGYTNGGDAVDTIPDQSTPINSIPVDIYVATGNAQTVNVKLIDSKYVTTESLKAHREKIPIDHPDKSVTESKMADNSVNTRAIVDSSVTEEKLSFKVAHLVEGKVPIEELPELSTSEVWRFR